VGGDTPPRGMGFGSSLCSLLDRPLFACLPRHVCVCVAHVCVHVLCVCVYVLCVRVCLRCVSLRHRWGVAAKITPTVLLATGAAFFSLILAPKPWAPVAAALGTTPLMLAVLIGAAQNILSKSSK